MRLCALPFCLILGGLVLQLSARPLPGQDTANAGATPEPVTFTTQEDHRNMLEQLGITKLRPGPSGNEIVRRILRITTRRWRILIRICRRS